jgi:hypothetical protein
MKMRKFSDEWYECGVNQFPRLQEYWYQQYVKAHPEEFGFTRLEGPFETGPDFKGVSNGNRVSVEVERDYISYRYHEHQNIDVLIVGVLDPPLPVMFPFLPPIIKNLDPQKVLDWSEPKRREYWQEMEKRRESLPKQLEWVQRNLEYIKASRIKDERVQVILREQAECECGGVMLGCGYDPELDGEIGEGQLADYYAGFWKVFKCRECGVRVWVESEGGDIPGKI